MNAGVLDHFTHRQILAVEHHVVVRRRRREFAGQRQFRQSKPVSGEKCEVTVYHPTTVIGHFDDQKIVQAWLDGSKKCPL